MSSPGTPSRLYAALSPVALALALGAAPTSSAWAWDAVAVSNSHFDQPALALGAIRSGSEALAGWTPLRIAGSGAVLGVFRPSGDWYSSLQADGSVPGASGNVAFGWNVAAGEGLTQKLGTLPAGRVRVTVALGQRSSPDTFAGVRLQLVDGSGVTVAQRDIAALGAGQVGFRDVSLEVTTTASSCTQCSLRVVSLGQGAGTGRAYFDVDQVRVARVDAPTSLTLDLPVAGAVVQRRAAGASYSAGIPVMGSSSDLPEGGQVQARLLAASGAVVTDWRGVTWDAGSRSFSGTLPYSGPGGELRVEVRRLAANGSVLSSAAPRAVGVGDVYVVAGQSNSASFGQKGYASSQTSNRTLDITGQRWVKTNDVMPSISGFTAFAQTNVGGGSVWPQVGDALVAREGVPVGFVSLGYGGSSVAQWDPAVSGSYFSYYRRALATLAPTGFKAFLWHQGEADANMNVSTDTHAATLARVIAGVRQEAGWDAPFYVSLVSRLSVNSRAAMARITAAQLRTVRDGTAVRVGARTNSLAPRGLTDAANGNPAHFSAAGLAEHARQWVNVLAGSNASTGAPLFNAGFDAQALQAGQIAAFDASGTDVPANLAGWEVWGPALDGLPASGAWGVFNPDAGFYATASRDAAGRFVPAGARDAHSAFFFGVPSGTLLVQTSELTPTAGKTVHLNVSLGRRLARAGESHAGLDVCLTLDARALVCRSVSGDALAAGRFSAIALDWAVPAGTPRARLGVRLQTLRGGAGTYADIDDVRLTQD